jgi:HK97 family phage prohead protease
MTGDPRPGGWHGREDDEKCMSVTTPNHFNFIEPGQEAQLVDELDDGDLLLRGFAAIWDGVDRQNENFVPGAFTAAISDALTRAAGLPLCLHHDRSRALGEVLHLSETDEGLLMVARVDGAIRHDPLLRTVYEQIKRGTLRALSVGGFFARKLTAAGYRIARADLTEISITPVPVLAGPNGPSFAVVAGKALGGQVDEADLRASLASFKALTSEQPGEPAWKARIAFDHARFELDQQARAVRRHEANSLRRQYPLVFS